MIDDKDIEKMAYELWEKAGKPEGRDLEFWESAKKSFYSLSKENFKDAVTILEGDKNKSQRLGWTITQTIGFPVYNSHAISRVDILWSENEKKLFDLKRSIDNIKENL